MGTRSHCFRKKLAWVFADRCTVLACMPASVSESSLAPGVLEGVLIPEPQFSSAFQSSSDKEDESEVWEPLRALMFILARFWTYVDF